ncbi:MAG: hypothetical protein OEZ43_11030 [Gammaproteobacteria bacterium]|nr:hypothetical protein [Gammaproteobacteria bacterium]
MGRFTGKHILNPFLYRCVLFVNLLFFCACSETEYQNISPEDYTYQVPVQLNDGIAVATITDVGAAEDTLAEMVRNRLRDHYGKIDSVLVFKSGRLILEEYFSAYDISTKHDMRSATKSITSLLAGIAIQENFIEDEYAKVTPYFKNEPFG